MTALHHAQVSGSSVWHLIAGWQISVVLDVTDQGMCLGQLLEKDWRLVGVCNTDLAVEATYDSTIKLHWRCGTSTLL